MDLQNAKKLIKKMNCGSSLKIVGTCGEALVSPYSCSGEFRKSLQQGSACV